MILGIQYDKYGCVVSTTELVDINAEDEFTILGCSKVSINITDDTILKNYKSYGNRGIYYNLEKNCLENRNIELLEVSVNKAKPGEIITIKSKTSVVLLINGIEFPCKGTLNLSFSSPGIYKIIDPEHINLANGFMPVILEIVDG